MNHDIPLLCEAEAPVIPTRKRTGPRKPARLFTLLDRGDISPFEMSVLAQLRAGTLPEERVRRALFGVPPGQRVDSTATAAAIFGPLLRGRDTEAFAVAGLSRSGELVEADIITTGSESATVMCKLQVLRWAFTRRSPVASLVVAHNHPSCSAEPSMQDRDATQNLCFACEQAGLRLHDHLIIVDRAPWYVSFAERGLLYYNPQQAG